MDEDHIKNKGKQEYHRNLLQNDNFEKNKRRKCICIFSSYDLLEFYESSKSLQSFSDHFGIYVFIYVYSLNKIIIFTNVWNFRCVIVTTASKPNLDIMTYDSCSMICPKRIYNFLLTYANIISMLCTYIIILYCFVVSFNGLTY